MQLEVCNSQTYSPCLSGTPVFISNFRIGVEYESLLEPTVILLLLLLIFTITFPLLFLYSPRQGTWDSFI